MMGEERLVGGDHVLAVLNCSFDQKFSDAVLAAD